MKKIFYLANIRIPTEKAHGLQIMKTCQALAEQGVDVELVVPRRRNPNTSDPFVWYNITPNFKITTLPCVDFISGNFFGPLGYWLTSYTFFRSAKKYLKKQNGVCYTRDLPVAYWWRSSSQPLFYEIHTLPNNTPGRHRAAWNNSAGLIVITNGLKNDLLNQGVLEAKILVAPDAVDLVQFGSEQSRVTARAALSLPASAKTVVYTGHLYDWKGASVLASAARQLPSDVFVYIVGGTGPDLAQFKSRYGQINNLKIIGHRPNAEVPVWQHAADVLVLPNLAEQKISSHYTSPLKLFEYLAAGRAIVASDLPSTREILNQNNAIFFTPGDPGQLAAAVVKVLNNQELSDKISAQARHDSKAYSWQNRAQKIASFLWKRPLSGA